MPSPKPVWQGELRVGTFRCPVHEDRSPSLSVMRKADGKWVVTCFAGCARERVLGAVGLTWKDLYPDAGPYRSVPRTRAPIVVPPVPRGLDPETDGAEWAVAWGEAVAKAQEQDAQSGAVWRQYPKRDLITAQRETIAERRARASAACDTDETWAKLAALSAWETAVNQQEAELDAELARRSPPNRSRHPEIWAAWDQLVDAEATMTATEEATA